MATKTECSTSGVILYDEALLDHADVALFTPPASAALAVGGRGSTWIVSRGAEQWVLRHYRRGGLPARFNRDLYLWTGLASSRAWREWRLLDLLYKEGLPVPQPVAARVERHGFFYRADLLTRRVPDAKSVAERLTGGASLPWEGVGATVRRFHDAQVRHADLNVHNILVDAAGRIFLLDFDRGARAAGDAWKPANLRRLHRSLLKVGGAGASSQDHWQRFLKGYQEERRGS